MIPEPMTSKQALFHLLRRQQRKKEKDFAQRVKAFLY